MAPFSRVHRATGKVRWRIGAFLVIGGLLWLFISSLSPTAEPSSVATLQRQTLLQPGTVASMDSPVFTYSPGWQVNSTGADPQEPADPWNEPAGVVTFVYTGSELALQLATGDYWGYLYVTVDGEPANRLTHIPNNDNSLGEPAGYTTFYAPEAQEQGQPTAHWVRVHTKQSDQGRHAARIEVWRSWGQIPLRAVAIDALNSPGLPPFPGILLLVAGLWLIAWGVGADFQRFIRPLASRLILSQQVRPLFLPQISPTLRQMLALGAVALVAIAVYLQLWQLCLVSLALLAYLAVARPVLWLGALVFGLPFYFSQFLPLLPNRSAGIIEIGLLGGLVVLLANRLFFPQDTPDAGEHSLPAREQRVQRTEQHLMLVVAAMIGWALVVTFAAPYFAEAIREWRSVFLSAGIFLLLLTGTLAHSSNPNRERWLLVFAWMAGATVVALIGLWQLASDTMLIRAEGVTRIRALYGSPNNLALYLERSVAVSLTLSLFIPSRRHRLLWGALALPQLLALLLTFSKGALLLGLPTIFLTLWIGGMILLRQRQEFRRMLWVIALIAGLVVGSLLPFLGTERLHRLLDFSEGTGYFRLQLWRSAWQMALDHPIVGVGPDNFLYVFRSAYLLPTAWQEPNLNHPHNLILDLWTRLGIPGVLLGLIFFGLGLWILWQRFLVPNQKAPEQNVLTLGLIAAALAGLAHGLIDVSYTLPDLMLVWILIFFLLSEDAATADSKQPTARFEQSPRPA